MEEAAGIIIALIITWYVCKAIFKGIISLIHGSVRWVADAIEYKEKPRQPPPWHVDEHVARKTSQTGWVDYMLRWFGIIFIICAFLLLMVAMWGDAP